MAKCFSNSSNPFLRKQNRAPLYLCCKHFMDQRISVCVILMVKTLKFDRLKSQIERSAVIAMFPALVLRCTDMFWSWISIPQGQVSETPFFRNTWVETDLNYDTGVRDHNTWEIFNSIQNKKKRNFMS